MSWRQAARQWLDDRAEDRWERARDARYIAVCERTANAADAAEAESQQARAAAQTEARTLRTEASMALVRQFPHQADPGSFWALKAAESEAGQ